MKLFAPLLFILLLAQSLCHAHAPYEVDCGDFVRDDNAKIHVVKYFTDGLFGADPNSVLFRQPDGTVLARTAHTRSEKAVWIRSRSVEILEFDSDWIPIASAVSVFDGHSLTNLPTANRALISPIAHVAANWRAYLISTFLVAITAIGFILVRRLANQHEWEYFGKFIAAIFLCVTGFFGLIFTLALPTSPFIVAMFVTIITWITINLLDRRNRRIQPSPEERKSP